MKPVLYFVWFPSFFVGAGQGVGGIMASWWFLKYIFPKRGRRSRQARAVPSTLVTMKKDEVIASVQGLRLKRRLLFRGPNFFSSVLPVEEEATMFIQIRQHLDSLPFAVRKVLHDLPLNHICSHLVEIYGPTASCDFCKLKGALEAVIPGGKLASSNMWIKIAAIRKVADGFDWLQSEIVEDAEQKKTLKTLAKDLRVTATGIEDVLDEYCSKAFTCWGRKT